jgi:hypothetical protein
VKRIILIMVVLFSAGRLMAAQGDNWNVRFQPFGLLVGLLISEIDYKVNENIVVGPSLLYWNFSGTDITAKMNGFGAQGAYYFDSVFNDGFYVGGRFNTMSMSVSGPDLSGNELTSSASGSAIGIKGGYHWFWDSFNINLGLSAGSSSIAKAQVKDSNGNVVSETSAPAIATGLDFMMGFSF